MSNLMIAPSLPRRMNVQRPNSPSRFQGLSQPKMSETQSGAAQKASAQKPNYQSPSANPWAMGLLTMLNDYLVFSGVPVLRSIPLVNRLPGVKGFTGIDQLDFPEADLARLKQAMGPDKVSFIGPNHPEFFTDWVVDKKLSSMAAPSVACWADAGIVNGNSIQKRFLLANNIIANNGKEKAREDSIKAAIQGQGVLLHPEGRVWWHGDKVHSLFPGMMQMAVAAANHPDSKDKPVYLVPVSWKFEFDKDVSAGLHQDMADIEKKLKLSIPKGLPVGQRFFRLQEAMLAHQQEQFGYPKTLRALHQNLPYFERQQQFQKFLIQQLEKKYGDQPGDSSEAKQVNLERAVSRAGRENPTRVSKEDRNMLKELFRLEGFSPELYNRPYLTQEHLHENIKRSMQSFFGGLKTMVPQPAGGRVLHIRVAEPIPVREQLRPEMSETDRHQVAEHLQTQVQTTLQRKLDEINEEIAPSVARFQVKNEAYSAPNHFAVKSKL